MDAIIPRQLSSPAADSFRKRFREFLIPVFFRNCHRVELCPPTIATPRPDYACRVFEYFLSDSVGVPYFASLLTGLARLAFPRWEVYSSRHYLQLLSGVISSGFLRTNCSKSPKTISSRSLNEFLTRINSSCGKNPIAFSVFLISFLRPSISESFCWIAINISGLVPVSPASFIWRINSSNRSIPDFLRMKNCVPQESQTKY